MKASLLAAIMLLPFAVSAQKERGKPNSGMLELGMRTTTSLFTDAGSPGTGFGGQFRLKFAKRLNTEWYADYITTDIRGIARRTDGHIGWSVMFYPFNDEKVKGAFNPYLIAGHCFDYTKVEENANAANMGERWSSAMQAGLGAHYNLTDQFDVSLAAQYMTHLGNDMHADVHSHDGEPAEVHIEEHGHTGVEGHVLVTLSLNVKVADLW